MIVIEQKEAAEILGVTPRTLRDWREKYPERFPDCSAGYDIDKLKAFRDWIDAKGSDRDSQMRTLKILRANEALKRDKIRTRREELDLESKEGQLLPRPSHEHALANLLSGLADWCEQLPDLIAGDCCKKCQKSIGARIKAELDRRREQLAEDLKRPSQES